MISETWKDIPGYEGIYQASNLGKVRSLDRFENFDNRAGNKISIRRRKGRVLKHMIRKGYCSVWIRKNGSSTTKGCHHLVALAFLGVPPHKVGNHLGGYQVNHKDCNKQNNRVENLEWVTREENIKHGQKHNLFAHGENVKHAKLTEKDVLEILESQLNTVQLGKMYGVSNVMVGLIKRKKAWRYLHA